MSSTKRGTEIPIGDALSRANLPDAETDLDEVAVNTVDYITVTPGRLKVFQEHTAHEMNELHQVILKGWPDHKQEAPHCVREFWNVRDVLSVTDGVILKGIRLVVSPTMRQRFAEPSPCVPSWDCQV